MNIVQTGIKPWHVTVPNIPKPVIYVIYDYGIKMYDLSLLKRVLRYAYSDVYHRREPDAKLNDTTDNTKSLELTNDYFARNFQPWQIKVI